MPENEEVKKNENYKKNVNLYFAFVQHAMVYFATVYEC